MNQNLKSGFYPEMDPFFARLEKALRILPNDPKPFCYGFYLCSYNGQNDILVTEKIGSIPLGIKIENECRSFATKKVVVTMCRDEMRSVSHGNQGAFYLWSKLPDGINAEEWKQDVLEMSPRAGSIGLSCVGVDGHNPMVNEAIAILFLAAMGQRNNPLPFEHINFWNNLNRKVSNFSKKYIPDNPWIKNVADAMIDP